MSHPEPNLHQRRPKANGTWCPTSCRRSLHLKMLARVDCLVLLVFLAAVSPVRGQLFGSSPQRDIEQGAEVAKQVEQQIGLYSLPKADAYVSELGARLAATANDPRWKFTFHIVDQQEPNAFAIP